MRHYGVKRLSPACHTAAHARRIGINLAARRTLARTQHYLSYGGPAYARNYPINVSVPSFIGGVRQKRFLSTTQILGRADTLPTIYKQIYPRRGRYRDRYVRRGVGSRPITVNCLRHFTTSCRHLSKRDSLPRYRRGGKIGITVINSNPTKLSYTNSLMGTNFSIAIFRTLRRVNKILGCNVPRFQLPGTVMSIRVSGLEGLKIRFIGGYVINGAVAVPRLRDRNFRTVFVTAKTKLPGFVGVPNRGTIKILSSGRCLAHIGLVSTDGPRDSAPVAGTHDIVIIKKNGATVSSYHATGQLKTRRIFVTCHHDRTRVPTHIRRVGRTGRRKVRFLALRGPVRCVASRGKTIYRIHLRIVRLNRPSRDKQEGPIPIRKRIIAHSVSRTVITMKISPGPVIPHSIRKLRLKHGGAVIIGRHVRSSVPAVFTKNSVIHKNTAIVLTVKSKQQTTASVVRHFGARREAGE